MVHGFAHSLVSLIAADGCLRTCRRRILVPVPIVWDLGGVEDVRISILLAVLIFVILLLERLIKIVRAGLRVTIALTIIDVTPVGSTLARVHLREEQS